MNQIRKIIQAKADAGAAFDPRAASALRSQLWSLANSMNALGVPVKAHR